MSANEFTVDKIGDSIPTIFDSNPRTVEGSPNSSNATMADFDSLTSYFDSQFGIVLSLDDANVEHAAWAANLVSRSAMDQIIGQRAAIGSYVNRLNFTIDNLLGVSEATSKARSQIQDADFATESARLAKAQVIQQSGAAMLAQANAQPQMILSLIR
jgi:flagellin